MNEAFMRKAIELSIENVKNGGGPFGAVIVRGDEIIATGVNRVTDNNDPTAHAEVSAIRAACQKLGTFNLEGCEIYTSCEPCPMCLGAIYWAHLDKMYYGNNTWYYRVDHETAGQRLLGANNYKESKSFSLNAHNGLELVKNNLKPDADAELYSFADIYSAIEGNDGNIANAANTEAVNRLNEIFTKGRIIYVMAEGLATSQDNYIGEGSENVGLERNKTLAYNRAYTVVNWLKGNEKFRNVSNNVFAVNALVNPIVKVDDKSVQGLNSKLGRCVKVRIHFVIDK